MADASELFHDTTQQEYTKPFTRSAYQKLGYACFIKGKQTFITSIPSSYVQLEAAVQGGTTTTTTGIDVTPSSPAFAFSLQIIILLAEEAVWPPVSTEGTGTAAQTGTGFVAFASQQA